MRKLNPPFVLIQCLVVSIYLVGASLTFAEEWLPDIRREERTDTVEEKLKLIQQATQSGRFDLALSLTESLKDTLDYERQLHSTPNSSALDIDRSGLVSDLPTNWARWANGWKYVHVLSATDSTGIARTEEPVDILLSFENSDTIDLRRELRVARIESATGTLHEIRSQVYGVQRKGNKLFARLVFFADVPASASVNYLLFYGNPQAELPRYASDLQVDGKTYGLDITNHHFVASLSKQTGQLERLRYTRQHGLELYAGGKGHGEPPTIDWSNDYVDQEHFQKLRIRNWAEPPNYEVVRGPLMVRVRRWGFPHSPMHPVFTPSRMHIDQTYTFYAGKDYLIKAGTMEAVKDFDFTTMRDDEWVLSGYSFTDKLWLDAEGQLQEGDVPAHQSKQMQGVGFYHKDSRDAFLALWLEHTAHGIDSLEKNGVPTLHYHQHGQLWSRYPVGSEKQHFKRGTTLHQRNAYLVAPFPTAGAAEQISKLRQRLLQPLSVTVGKLPVVETPTTTGALAREGETPDNAALKNKIWQALRKVVDEQFYRIDSNVVDMGLIYDVRLHEGVVEVLMTMPHRGRPVYQFFVTQGGGRNSLGIRERLLQLEGVNDVIVHHTWHPAWKIDRLTKAGRRSLGIDP